MFESRNIFKKIIHKHHMSSEQKKLLSYIRKEWSKNNPEKQREIHLKAMKSKPCQLFKEFLTKNNIFFIEEYNPCVEGRNFHIDIVIPDKMVAIEINGKRHYDKFGKLTSYYQERHDLISEKGWKIYEIYYTCCFSESTMGQYLEDIMNMSENVAFNHIDHLNNKKTENSKKYTTKTCNCGSLCCRKAERCRVCSIQKKTEKIPTKEQLLKLMFGQPSTKIAEMFQVSDKTIQKWCARHQIEKPKRGYWAKRKSHKFSSELLLPNNLFHASLPIEKSARKSERNPLQIP